MQKILKTNWEAWAASIGFSALEIDWLHICFIACDEELLGT
jgi:hypothetical protein